jgi:isopentenyl-diphosphate delta-isomerase
LVNSISKRKLEHIKIVLNENVEPVPSSFIKIKLTYNALPDLALDEIDTSVSVWNKKISFPFMIASMTGGPTLGAKINKNLALGCQSVGVPLALGSTRIALKNTDMLHSFQIRKFCPDIPLFINIGIVQLNYGITEKEINWLIKQIQADGIFFHINHLQEAVQPEGDTDFKGLINKLRTIIPKIEGVVLAKEVGAGIDFGTARKLYDAGVKWIDTAGMGGTSWTVVEGSRREDNLGQVLPKRE